ncbi:MAG: hypothetical protein K6F15_03040 [Treponema sp.]|nr:hypothetical protein [Treponema sp.]
MKRIISLLGILFLILVPVFAQSEDEAESNENQEEENIVREDDDYKINGKGDQFIKIGLMPNIPLNFGDSLYVGGAAQLGYYRFFNGWFGIGGDLMAGYNPTLGSNVLTFVPVTVGVMVQPTVWHFEFPLFASVGMAFETCANKKYFPGFASKIELGAFYRIVESWSVGLTGQWLFLDESYTTTDGADADYGSFLQFSVSGRYHF